MSSVGIQLKPERSKLRSRGKNAYISPEDVHSNIEQKKNVITDSENEPGFEEGILPSCSSKEASYTYRK